MYQEKNKINIWIIFGTVGVFGISEMFHGPEAIRVLINLEVCFMFNRMSMAKICLG